MDQDINVAILLMLRTWADEPSSLQISTAKVLALPDDGRREHWHHLVSRIS